jgi:NAD(P)-dependent dehydrogenase (short-subunit alcohol dehydrogenase family)
MKDIEVQLDHKVAIITGAARGIGQAVAMALGQQGALVVPVDLSLEDLGNTIEKLRTQGTRVLPLAADVSDWNSVQAFVAQTNHEFGAIHILVNVAGIQGPIGPLVETM